MLMQKSCPSRPGECQAEQRLGKKSGKDSSSIVERDPLNLLLILTLPQGPLGPGFDELSGNWLEVLPSTLCLCDQSRTLKEFRV